MTEHVMHDGSIEIHFDTWVEGKKEPVRKTFRTDLMEARCVAEAIAKEFEPEIKEGVTPSEFLKACREKFAELLEIDVSELTPTMAYGILGRVNHEYELLKKSMLTTPGLTSGSEESERSNSTQEPRSDTSQTSTDVSPKSGSNEET